MRKRAQDSWGDWLWGLLGTGAEITLQGVRIASVHTRFHIYIYSIYFNLSETLIYLYILHCFFPHFLCTDPSQ